MAEPPGPGTDRAPAWYGAESASPAPVSASTNLADILERVLDKGIVIAGDIKVNLLDIELLTIKLRLVVASVDRAREMGIDWWEGDPSLSSQQRELVEENRRLRKQLERRRADDQGGPGTTEQRQRRRPSRSRTDAHRE